MSSGDKIKATAQQFLEVGEEVLVGFYAAPHGWALASAGSRKSGQAQRATEKMLQSVEASARAGFEAVGPMALAITQRRLLSLKVGARVGMGIGGGVKELRSAVPLSEVDSITPIRLALGGKVVEISMRGQTFKLDAGRAKVEALVEVFERSTGKSSGG